MTKVTYKYLGTQCLCVIPGLQYDGSLW